MILQCPQKIRRLAIILLIGSSCTVREPVEGHLEKACTDLLKSQITEKSDFSKITAEESAPTSDEEKIISLEVEEDANKLPLVMVSFCELVLNDELPGIGTGHGEFSAGAARDDTRERFNRILALDAAAPEKDCDNLYYVTLVQGGRENLY